MIERASPIKAETSDIGTAVFRGADAREALPGSHGILLKRRRATPCPILKPSIIWNFLTSARNSPTRHSGFRTAFPA